jgi:hypothetical protein
MLQLPAMPTPISALANRSSLLRDLSFVEESPRAVGDLREGRACRGRAPATRLSHIAAPPPCDLDQSQCVAHHGQASGFVVIDIEPRHAMPGPLQGEREVPEDAVVRAAQNAASSVIKASPMKRS